MKTSLMMHCAVVPVLGKQRQEDQESKVFFGCIVSTVQPELHGKEREKKKKKMGEREEEGR